VAARLFLRRTSAGETRLTSRVEPIDGEIVLRARRCATARDLDESRP
jgi:hypothetical protein